MCMCMNVSLCKNAHQINKGNLQRRLSIPNACGIRCVHVYECKFVQECITNIIKIKLQDVNLFQWMHRVCACVMNLSCSRMLTNIIR